MAVANPMMAFVLKMNIKNSNNFWRIEPIDYQHLTCRKGCTPMMVTTPMVIKEIMAEILQGKYILPRRSENL